MLPRVLALLLMVAALVRGRRADVVAPGGWRPARARRWIAAAALVLVLGAAGTFGFIYSGLYDVGATRQHTPPVYWALITTLRQSIQAHAAREVGPVPDLWIDGRWQQGLVQYERHCLPCHGAPGVAMHDLGMGLTPAPANLLEAGRHWPAEEIYWTISNGLKMTGMPAWQHRMSADEMWSIVAFVKMMPSFTPMEYRAVRARLVGVPPAPPAPEVEP